MRTVVTVFLTTSGHFWKMSLCWTFVGPAIELLLLATGC